MEAVRLYSISKLVMDLDCFMPSKSFNAMFLDQRPVFSLQIYNRTNCSELASCRTSLEVFQGNNYSKGMVPTAFCWSFS